ncbi:hypothetical protein [Pseudophaeobacter sp.]|uniref:hypothetical protein n=1 Tax=Pseudophaeobacter sp. TaxID=1971739 RepID=UPI003296FCC8
MNLIDPTTPAGFFHMRLVPYADQLRSDEMPCLTTKWSPDTDSYFETPRSLAGAAQILCDSNLLSGDGVVDSLLALWKEQSADLVALGADLKGLRASVAAPEQKQNTYELTDFVYPLF